MKTSATFNSTSDTRDSSNIKTPITFSVAIGLVVGPSDDFAYYAL
jgi:hypothetical protein